MNRSCNGERPATEYREATGRFVFLWHEMPHGADRASHYDLMFQQGHVLRTWAVETLPSSAGKSAGKSVPARALPLHRLAYLEYEGEVSGGRGRVKQIASGRCELIEEAPQRVLYRLLGTSLDQQIRFQLLADDEWEACFVSLSKPGSGNSDAS